MSKRWLVVNFNNKYFLKVGSKIYGCQIGEGGLIKAVKKTEGDKSTPTGKWYLKTVFYRSDKVLRPKLKRKNILKIKKITKNCGWCDDIKSNYYNKHIKISNFKSPELKYEKLWRKDNAYDIFIEISHNLKPTIRNRGSAVFIHCSFSDKRKTAGCVALEKKDLFFLLKNVKNNSYIKI